MLEPYLKHKVVFLVAKVFFCMFTLSYIRAHLYMYERISIYLKEELQMRLQICAF